MGSGAESAATAANTAADTSSYAAQVMPTTGEIAGAVGNTGAGTGFASAGQGFSIEPATTNMTGPTMYNASRMDNINTVEVPQQGNFFTRFMDGQNQDLGQAYENFGNNPETYGYLFNKVYTVVKSLGGGGGQQQAAPITINTNYQQETDNPYLRKYRRY